MTTELEEKIENAPNNIDYIVIARDSKYSYLDDGRTQRYKTIENKLCSPQDILVFIPDYKWIINNCPTDQLTNFGENRVQYEQILLRYIQTHGKKAYVTDSKGKF